MQTQQQHTRPPRPPLSTMQVHPGSTTPGSTQLSSSLALLKGGSVTRNQPAMPGLLTGHANAQTTGAASSLQSLKEQADHMLQQQRTDQKNKEEMIAQLKAKEQEIHRLSTMINQHTSTNTDLQLKLQKTEEKCTQVMQKIEYLTLVHDQLIQGVQQSGAELARGREEAEELDVKYKQQAANVEELASGYQQLLAERSILQSRLETALETASAGAAQLQAAHDKEKVLQQQLATALQREQQQLAEAAGLQARVKDLQALEAAASAEAHRLAVALPTQVAAVRHELETRIASESASFQADKAALTAQLNSATNQAAALEGAVKYHEQTISDLKQQLQDANDAAIKLQDTISALQHDVSEAAGQLAARDLQMEQLQAELSTALSERDGLELALKGVQNQLEQQTDAYGKAQADMREAEASHTIALEAAAADRQADKLAFDEALRNAETELEKLKQQLLEMKNENEKAAMHAAQQMDKLSADLKEAQDLVASKAAELEAAVASAARVADEHRKELDAASTAGVLSKQQVEARVQKAVEANSKQAQKALDEQKKKSAAELKKAQEAVLKLTDKVSSLEKAVTTAKAAADKEISTAAKLKEEAVVAAEKLATEKAAAAAQEAEKALRESLAAGHAAELAALVAEREKLLLEQTIQLKKEHGEHVAALQSDFTTRLSESAAAHEAALAAARLQATGDKDTALQAALNEVSDVKMKMTELVKQKEGMQSRLAVLESQLLDADSLNDTLRHEAATAKEAAAAAEMKAAQAALAMDRKEQEACKNKHTPAAATDTHAADITPVDGMKTSSKGKSGAGKPGRDDANRHDGFKKPAAVEKPKNAPPPPAKRKAQPIVQSQRVYADIGDSDMESEGGRHGTGLLGGLFQGSTPQYMKRQRVDHDVIDKPSQPSHATMRNGRSLFSGSMAASARPSQAATSLLGGGMTQSVMVSGGKSYGVTGGEGLSSGDPPANRKANQSHKSAKGSALLPGGKKSGVNARGRLKNLASNQHSIDGLNGLFSGA